MNSPISLKEMINCPSFLEALAQCGQGGAAFSVFKEQLLAQINATMPPQDQPVFYHTMGVPASGKTTLLHYMFEKGDFFPLDSYFLGFDRIMDNFPPYQNDMREHGPSAAFTRWELPARALGYELLEYALNRRGHIVLEHSAARADHLDMLKAAKERGYKVVLLETLCKRDSLVDRALARKRHLPLHYIDDRSAALEKLRPMFYELADELYVFDMNNFPPQQINK